MNRPFIFLLIILLGAPGAAFAALSEPASDAGANYFVKAGTLKTGISVGPDSRTINVLVAQDISATGSSKDAAAPVAASASYTINPSAVTFNMDGNVSKTFPDVTISFVDPTGSAPLVFTGNEYVVMAHLPLPLGTGNGQVVFDKPKTYTADNNGREQVQITMTAAIQPGGNSLLLSNIIVAYKGAEFMKKREWGIQFGMTRDRKKLLATSHTLLKFIFLPGTPIP